MKEKIIAIIMIIILTISLKIYTPTQTFAQRQCCPPPHDSITAAGRCLVCNQVCTGDPETGLTCETICEPAKNNCRTPNPRTSYPGEYCNIKQNECVERQSVPRTTPCNNNANELCANTAIGKFMVSNYGAFLNNILRWGIGVGSGIAFLSLLWGSFTLTTAQGNPDKINLGKEIITSAIIGLIFLILSLTVLQIIGVNILNLRPLGF